MIIFDVMASIDKLNFKPDSVQAYAWFIWDFTRKVPSPTLHWIRRLDKEK